MKSVYKDPKERGAGLPACHAAFLAAFFAARAPLTRL